MSKRKQKSVSKTSNCREKNPNWRGGRSKTKHGYILLRVGKAHPLADVRGYAYEHRVVAEQKIGRKLQPNEQVHHINGNKSDNRPSNLEVLNIQYHRFAHRKSRKNRQKLPWEENYQVTCACGCGEVFWHFDNTGRPRDFVSGHNTYLKQQESADQVLKAIDNNWLTATEISIKTGLSISSVWNAVHRLKEQQVLILFKGKIFHKDSPPEKYVNPIIQCKCGCGMSFRKYDQFLRERKYVSGHNIHPRKRI